MTSTISPMAQILNLARQHRKDQSNDWPGVPLSLIPQLSMDDLHLHDAIAADLVHLVERGAVTYVVPGPEMDETDFDMHEVVELVQNQGISAYVMQTGGGCQTIYAGPTHTDDEGDERSAVCAGPGSGTTFSEIAVGHLCDFYIGRDDNGESDDFVCTDESWDVQAIADEIINRVTWMAANVLPPNEIVGEVQA